MRGMREVEAVHGAQLDAQRTDEAFGVGLAEAERRLEHEDIVVRTVDGGEDAVHVLELTAQPARLPRYTAYYGDTIRPTYCGYAAMVMLWRCLLWLACRVAGALLSRSSTKSIPRKRPQPRTSPISTPEGRGQGGGGGRRVCGRAESVQL